MYNWKYNKSLKKKNTAKQSQLTLYPKLHKVN